MLKPLLSLVFVLSQVQAASFDCRKASTWLEQSICTQPELSKADETMAKVYNATLKLSSNNIRFKQEQIAWIKGSYDLCQQGDTACLLSRYQQRTSELLNIQTQALATQQLAVVARFNLEHTSNLYDFQIGMKHQCQAAADSSCEGPAQVQVYAKHSHKLLQTIDMDNLFLSFRANAEPLTNSNQLYDYQGVINVGDFNFDGLEDFAIQNGNNGAYGGPSYDVYLRAATNTRFDYNSSLTELILATLGFFEVDKQHQRLYTSSKSGCCYHQNSEYRVIQNQAVEVKRHTEDATGPSGKLLITDEELRNGKWHTTASHSQEIQP